VADVYRRLVLSFSGAATREREKGARRDERKANGGWTRARVRGALFSLVFGGAARRCRDRTSGGEWAAYLWPCRDWFESSLSRGQGGGGGRAVDVCARRSSAATLALGSGGFGSVVASFFPCAPAPRPLSLSHTHSTNFASRVPNTLHTTPLPRKKATKTQPTQAKQKEPLQRSFSDSTMLLSAKPSSSAALRPAAARRTPVRMTPLVVARAGPKKEDIERVSNRE